MITWSKRLKSFLELEFKSSDAMRILITGASGFLGSALAGYWVERGHELCLLSRETSNLHRVSGLLDRVCLKKIERAEDVIEAVREFVPDAIVHTACTFGRRSESSLEMLDANLRFGVALLEAISQRDDRQTIFINAGSGLSQEVSLYALSKKHFAQWGEEISLRKPTSIKFINVILQQLYGPGDDPSKFTTRAIDACRRDEEFLAVSLGEQRRDFIYINDAVGAFDIILKNNDRFQQYDEIEVGSGVAVRVRDFLELVRRLANSKIRLDFGAVPYRKNEPKVCQADTGRLRSLGWVARYDLETGLKQTLNPYLAHP